MTPVSIVANTAAVPPSAPVGDTAADDGQQAFLDALLALLAEVATGAQGPFAAGAPESGDTPEAETREGVEETDPTPSDERSAEDRVDVAALPMAAPPTVGADPVGPAVARESDAATDASGAVTDGSREVLTEAAVPTQVPVAPSWAAADPPTAVALPPDSSAPPAENGPPTAAAIPEDPTPPPPQPAPDTRPADRPSDDPRPTVAAETVATLDPAPSASPLRQRRSAPTPAERGAALPLAAATDHGDDTRPPPAPENGADPLPPVHTARVVADALADPRATPHLAPREHGAPAPASSPPDGVVSAMTPVMTSVPQAPADSGASAATTVLAMPVPAEGVAELLSREVVRAAPGGEHRLELTLHPPELGRVAVNLVVGRDTVHAHLVAQTEGARELLLHHLPDLRDQLVAQGFADPHVSVDLHHRSGGHRGYRADHRDTPAPREEGRAMVTPDPVLAARSRDHRTLHLIA